MGTKKFQRRGAGQKIVDVNRKMGVKGIDKMQGTTRSIYDAVKLAATTDNNVIQLFKGCKTRQFPLTNLSENKLQVGESITLERMSCYIIECTTGTTNVLGVFNFGFFGFYERFYAGVVNFNIAQDQVIKDLPLTEIKAEFNPSANFLGMNQFQDNSTTPVGNLLSHPQSHEVFNFDNEIIIPPQIEFVANITLPPITLVSGADWYFCMRLTGLGSLFSPKGRY